MQKKSTWILGNLSRCDRIHRNVTDDKLVSLGTSLLDKMEKFVVLVYDKSNSSTTVNTVRRQYIYLEKSERFREIPTIPVLLVDDKRQLTVEYVVYQASMWVSLTPLHVLSDPKDFVWHMV